jgi:hypothetical protein
MSQLSQAMTRMTDRERRLVALLVGTFLVLVVGGSIYWASGRLSAKERRVKDMRTTIAQITAMETEYREAEGKQRQAEMKLKTNNTSLFSLLQKSAGQLGLTLNDLNERKTPVKDTDIVEVSVEVNLKEVSIDKLNTFLEKVEGKSSSGLVKVLKLKVKTRYDNPELLDVNMTVATWKAS